MGLPADRIQGWFPGQVLKRCVVLLILVAAWSCGGSDVPTGPGGDPVATTLTLSPEAVSMSSLGQSAQLDVTVLDQTGAVLTGAPVTWSSSAESVATVSPDGLVTAVGNGAGRVVATSGAAADTVTVTVMQVADTITIAPSPAVLDGVGDTLRLEATVRDAGGSEVVGQPLSWSSSDEATVTVDSGLLSGVARGTASVTVSSGSLSTVVSVTVTETPTSITLSPTSLSFSSLGDTATVSAVVRDANGAEIQDATVSWSSSETTVATVGAGLVAAAGEGTATVTAYAGQVSASLMVSVTQVPSFITIAPDPVVLNGPGDTLTVVGTVRDAGGSGIAGESVAWSSGDESVLTVASDGLITAVASGTTTVSATSGSLSAAVTATVTVTPASIALVPDSVELSNLGDTLTLVATVLDADGNEISGAAVSWSSSDESIATVLDGLVTAVASGTATITATAGDLKASAVVVVRTEVQAPSFSQVVNEIFIRRGCTSGSCHGSGAGQMTLSTSAAANYATLVNIPAAADPSFLRVKPGDAFDSYLIMKLEGRAGARMPIGSAPLSATDLDNIKSWINAGAPNN